MKDTPVLTILGIAHSNGDLIAHLELKNISDHTIFLDTHSIGLSDEPTSRMFDIRDENGNIIPYKGMLVKRKYSKDDFIEVRSGGLIKTSTILNRWYEFPKGEKKYSITYNSINHSHNQQDMFEMESNNVVVDYKN